MGLGHFFLARQQAGERVDIPVRLALPGLRHHVTRLRPDVVVSTYHLAALAVARLRAQGRLDCPAVTFVTTFSAHELWLHPATDAYLCISADAAREVRGLGGGPVQVCGPVVRSEFGDQSTRRRAAVRSELGVAVAQRVALVVSGSLGLGTVRAAVTAIARWPGWVPVVVCGRNEHLRTQLAGVPGAVALGWVGRHGRFDGGGRRARRECRRAHLQGSTSGGAAGGGLPADRRPRPPRRRRWPDWG